MKLVKQSIALLLTLCICCSLSSGGVSAATKIDTEPMDTTILADRAEAYVTQYVENAYLYEEHDLAAGTIQSVAAYTDHADATGQESLTLHGERVPVAELCENIRNFEDMASYYRYTRSAQNIQRYNFTLATTVLNTEVGDDCATVELYAHITFQYEEGGETAECGDRYQVTFGKVGGTWCIVDIVSEEMIAYGMTPDSFNLDAAIAEFDRLQEQGPVVQMVEPENQTDGAAEPAALNDAVNTYRYYNRDNATAYAYTYTTDSYTGSSGNNTNFTNDNFSYYSDANCQNFASQCIWAGLGGSDTSDDIDSLKFPMDTNGSNQWYCNGQWSAVVNWTNTHKFYEYVNSSSAEKTGTRMNASIYTLSAGQSFASITNAVTRLSGAVLQVYGSDEYGDYSHSIFVTGVTGTGYGSITFCANSPMRKAAKLSDYSRFTSHSIRVIIPYAMIRSRVCSSSGHTYASSSTGTSCYCTKCGECKLTITGSMLRPLRVGSTATITGTANVKCFRIAIGITKPSGSTSWREFTSTSRATLNYTFNERGLYTVVVAARDVATMEDHSCKETHTFKVRIY